MDGVDSLLLAASSVEQTGRDEVMDAALRVSQDEIAAFCERWRVTELALFGSAIRLDFGPESDIDVLVSFDSGARPTLFDIVHMQDELGILFDRKVDLVTRASVEDSRNYIRRKAILESAQVIYAA